MNPAGVVRLFTFAIDIAAYASSIGAVTCPESDETDHDEKRFISPKMPLMAHDFAKVDSLKVPSKPQLFPPPFHLEKQGCSALLACHQFSGPKDKDLTIIERPPVATVTVRLGDLRFGKMKKGKGRDFDSTFRLSILAVVVIFLPAAFLVLVNF